MLEILASASPDEGMGLVEIAHRAGLAPSTAHRLLSALERHGYVEQDPLSRDYRLGSTLVTLGLRARRGINLRRQAMPIMEALARQTGEDVYLCVRRETESLLIEWAPGTHAVRLAERLGERMPLHRGAGSKVLLAHLDSLAIDAYLHRHFGPEHRGHSEVRRLLRDLALIRERGYAVSVGEYAADSASLAAPVRDFTGAVTAALCILLPRGRLARSQAMLLERLKEAAAQLSAHLGHLRLAGN